MKKFGLILFLLLFPILSFAGDDWYLFEWDVWDGISDFGSSSAVTCGFTQYRIPFGSADGCLTESFVTSTDDAILQLSGTTASSLFEIQDSTGAFTHRFSADGAIQTNNFYVTVAGRVTAEDGFYSQYQHAAVGAAGYHANNIVYGSSVSQANWGSSFELTTNAQSVASGFRTLYLNMVNAHNTNYGFYNNVVGTDDIGNILTGIYSEITNGTGRNSVITGISGIATGGGGNPSSGYGVYGSASGSHTNYAGYFEDGDVYAENNLTVGGTIDAGDVVTIAKDVDNAEFPALYVKNSNEPANGETGQEVGIYFQLMGTQNNGSSFSTENVGYVKATKADDFWNASDKTEHDAVLEFGIMTNGTNAWSFKCDGTGTTFNGTIFAGRANFTTTAVVYNTANAIGIGYDAITGEGATADSYEWTTYLPTIDPTTDINNSHFITGAMATTTAAYKMSGLKSGIVCETFRVRHNELTNESGLTKEVALTVLPARTWITNCLIAVVEQGVHSGGTLTISLGMAGDYDELIVDSDGKGAANTVYGDADGEVGATLSGEADSWQRALLSWTTTTTITVQMEGSANLTSAAFTAGEYDCVICALTNSAISTGYK